MSLIPTQSIRAGWSKSCVEGYAAGVVIHELCDEVDSLRERIAALEARDAKMREALEGLINKIDEVTPDSLAFRFRAIMIYYIPTWAEALAKARAALLPATTSGDGREAK